jgi:amino acid adenylation domain-containing protein
MLVNHFLENSADRLPDKVALICEDKRLTYREINSFANQLSTALIDMGIKRQDRIVIFLDNSPESVISLFGILKTGAIFIILNPTMKSKKLNYILKDSGAKALITQKSKARIVTEAINKAPALEHIFWVGKLEHSQKNFPSTISSHIWEDIFTRPNAVVTMPQTFNIDLDLASIIYTSGSTGEPKGVMSAHYNMVAAAKSISHYLKNEEDDIIMDVLSLSFDYGLYQILMAFFFGGTVVLERSFAYPYKIIEKLIQEKVTGFPIVPTMLAILLEMTNLSKFDFSYLRYISNTAAPLPVTHIKKLQRLLPHVKIYSMYGLTECKRVSYLPPDQLDQRPESVGIPIPNEEVFIFDEDGQEVEPKEVGELVVRGSNVMQGYWNDPEETARVFRPGRYGGETLLYTGDLFKKDEEGYLYFIARKDDLIKTKAERVSPKEIENVLYEMNGVIEAAVIGVPDEIFGQAIKAFIITNEKSELNDRDVMKYCMKNLEPFMIPKYVEFRSALPKTTSGKIDKKQLS